MKDPSALFFIAGTLIGLTSVSLAEAENIDPANAGYQYAFAENVGWFSAEPNGDGGDGVQVEAAELSGWMWGENTGWISLSCLNTSTCATVDYGVSNDNCGELGGYAWAENVGWINFAPATGGVRIDPQTGEFSGTAWGENIGWVTFSDDSPVAYGVTTSWRRHAPMGCPEIVFDKVLTDLVITWGHVANTDGYDVFGGSLMNLLASGGDFSNSTDECLAENQPGTSFQQSLAAGSDASFFLVRAMNCGGNGTCDCGGGGQVNGRDSEIGSSGTCE
jgi:hypothetical protein